MPGAPWAKAGGYLLLPFGFEDLEREYAGRGKLAGDVRKKNGLNFFILVGADDTTRGQCKIDWL